MSFLFMLAGYFIPLSFDMKGPARFIKGRLFRLGIPLLIYIAIIHPVAVKLANPDVDILDYVINGVKSLHFFGWSGPLWFVLVLLIFTVIYTIVRISQRKMISYASPKNNFKSISILILIITIPAFFIRIKMPIGTAFMNLQFSFFSGYIVMFILGILSKRIELFDNVDYSTGKKWLIIALSIGYVCFISLMIFGGPMRGEYKILGGLTWQSFAYALWESFTCVTISIGIIGIFRNRFNRQNRVQKLLSDNYFGVYVFHTPILIAISISLRCLFIHPIVKFILVATCTIIASYVFTFFVRKIRFMKRIFS